MIYDIDDLWERIEPHVRKEPNGCWRWTLSLNSNGYGKYRWRPDTYAVHRVSYEFHVGEVPGGLELDHLCRNRACCNPDQS